MIGANGEASLLARALLFDMDGTLVDSTAVVERVWRRFADRYGLDASRVLEAAHGRRTADTVALFAPDGEDVDSVAASVAAEECEDINGVLAVPGAGELLSTLPARQWAVVTSAGRELAVRRMMAAKLEIPGVFITADDVHNGKPDPEGYLAAAARLRIPADSTLVFEDTDTGLAAANAAGAQRVAVGARNSARTLGLTQIADFCQVSAARACDAWLRVSLRCQHRAPG